MQEVKSAKNFNSKANEIGQVYAYGGLGLFGIMMAILLYFESDTYIIVISFIVYAVVLLYFIFKFTNKYSEDFYCRDCKSLIDAPLQNTSDDHQAILYYCENCEIYWHTGFTHNSS